MADMRAQLAVRVDRSGPSDARSEHIRADLARLRAHLDAAGATATRTQRLNATSLSKIQADIPSDTATIAFWYGEESVYAWAITHTSLTVYRVAHSAELTDLIGTAHQALAAGDDSPAITQMLKDLYVRLLAPLEEVRNKPRWVVIPDGPLNLVAFNALTDPKSNAPVLANHVISISPAVRLAAYHNQTRNSSWKALVVGDPVFDRDDPRLPSRTPHNRSPDAVQRTFSFQSLQRLPASAVEAQQIANLLKDKGEVDLLLGVDANLDRVLNAHLGTYDIIHLASHTIIDVEYPQLSAVALSKFDRTGAEQPYLLRAADLSTQPLHAQLVVMSACETALGKMTAGEGLVGFSYYLLSRGTRNVVGSLWKVPDQTTSTLMLEFYKLLAHREIEPAQALAFASRSLAASLSWRHPNAWSAFELYQMDSLR
jgi:CHAT domain-containing protein